MKRVLFIDEDMRRMKFYVEYLELEGFLVDSVRSDKDALEYLEKNRDSVGLIVLDIIMPSKGIFSREETADYKRTGEKLFSKIQKLAPRVPVVVLSIVNDKALKERMIKRGARAYLWKEATTPAVLAEKVRIHLKVNSMEKL